MTNNNDYYQHKSENQYYLNLLQQMNVPTADDIRAYLSEDGTSRREVLLAAPAGAGAELLLDYLCSGLEPEPVLTAEQLCLQERLYDLQAELSRLLDTVARAYLTPRGYKAFRTFYLDGLTLAETSRLVGIDPGNLHGLIHGHSYKSPRGRSLSLLEKLRIGLDRQAQLFPENNPSAQIKTLLINIDQLRKDLNSAENNLNDYKY
jgi:hypothetical protein